MKPVPPVTIEQTFSLAPNMLQCLWFESNTKTISHMLYLAYDMSVWLL